MDPDQEQSSYELGSESGQSYDSLRMRSRNKSALVAINPVPELHSHGIGIFVGLKTRSITYGWQKKHMDQSINITAIFINGHYFK
jgi:hypothetical protein